MGLTFAGTDIHTDLIHLEVVRGLAEPAEVRGTDDIAPGLAGRFARPRVEDRRIIELRGYVLGAGADVVERQQSWRDATDALMAVMDPTAAPATLTISAPLMGLTDSRSIEVRFLNAIAGALIGTSYQTWTIEMEAIGDPPDWEGSSS